MPRPIRRVWIRRGKIWKLYVRIIHTRTVSKVSTKSPKLLKIDYNKNMNKTNTQIEYQVVRNFFTDAQWDVIDMALNEFQDHDDYVEVLDTIGEKLQNVFDNSVDQSDLMSEGA